MLVAADQGTLAVASKRSGVTFADAGAEYLRWLTEDREREPSTISDYRGVLDGYLLPRFGARDLAAITPRDIEAYRDHLKSLTRADG
jgi:integrase-like protein